MLEFYSHGKLLLSGEYLILHGAKALTFPLKLGQYLQIEPDDSGIIIWRTYEKEKLVFSCEFQLSDFSILKTDDQTKSKYIQQLLLACKQLNVNAFANFNGFKATAKIEFDMNWGLGTSSTLINNLAQFAHVDALQLNQLISKGSGYDVACAGQNSPIIYQRQNNTVSIKQTSFTPAFINHLTLVYLNKKMVTEKNVVDFLAKSQNYAKAIHRASEITDKIGSTNSLSDFMQLLVEHEQIIAKTLQHKTVQDQYFSDFKGVVKSLGAWGGDFVLAVSEQNHDNQKAYFNEKGFSTVFPFKDLIL